MSIAITKDDVVILRTLADYRLVTVTQLALLTDRNENGLRRRLRKLRGSSLIDLLPATISPGLGRPSDVFSVSSKGLSLLQKEGELPSTVTFPQVDGKPLASQVAHQIHLNWCRAHLEYVARQMPDLSLKCVAMNSPFAADLSGTLIPVPGSEGVTISEKAENGFILPDAAFEISSSTKNKALLFFLEVDMSSEPIAAARQKRSSIGKKAVAYLAYFRNRGYKNYEAIFETPFNGFRVLFVTLNQSRMAALCRAFSSVQPDFIWVTTATRMFEEGISGRIWARGGNLKIASQSILGSLGQKLAIPKLGE
jgi:hypothetical protein